MKLVIATPLYPPESGGPATYAKLLEDGLPSRGIEVVLVKFGDVRHLPKVISHITYFLKVFQAAKAADIILSLDALSVGWPTVFANIFLRKKLVIKFVGDHIWEQGTQRFGIKQELDTVAVFSLGWHPYLGFLRLLQRITLRAADRIIVPSEYLKKVVMRLGITEEKISVIYNSIELGDVPAADPYGTRSHPRIVTVGRLVPWKHIDGVIDAVATISSSFAEANLTVVGDGPDRVALETRAKEKLGSHAFFTGAQTHEDVLAYIKNADVFVLNSSYEGLSHVLIEALMLGRAIVVSDAGGNPELITNEENGLVVPVGDAEALVAALTRVLSDDVLRARLAARALESSTRFAPDRMFTRTAELLQSLVADTRPTRV